MLMRFHDFKAALKEAFEKIEGAYQTKTKIGPEFRRFSALGFSVCTSGTVVCVAGGPDMYLASAAVNCLSCHADDKRPVAIFTPMEPSHFAIRMISDKSNVDMRRIRSGLLRVNDWGRMTTALGCLYDTPMVVNNSFSSFETIERQVLAYYRFRPKGFSLLVIDTLREIADNKRLAIETIGRLRALSNKLSLPIAVTLNIQTGESPYNLDAAPDPVYHAVKGHFDGLILLTNRLKKRRRRSKATQGELPLHPKSKVLDMNVARPSAKI